MNVQKENLVGDLALEEIRNFFILVLQRRGLKTWATIFIFFPKKYFIQPTMNFFFKFIHCSRKDIFKLKRLLLNFVILPSIIQNLNVVHCHKALNPEGSEPMTSKTEVQ